MGKKVHHSVWAPARASVGMSDVEFHSLRHSAASIMIAARMNVLEVER